jgi:HAD superfamily hydrolase (TIGR01509 family)
MIKAVIFDIDGVLLDSYDATYIYYKKLGKLLNLKAPSKADFHKKFYYQPTREMFKILNNIKDMAKFNRKLEKARGKITSHLQFEKLIDGSMETLQALHKKYKLGLATSRSKTGLDRYLKFSKTKKFFKAVVGLEHVKNHKPHPEPLLLVARKLKVTPNEAVYVGDAPTDLLAARAAGMRSIIYGSKKIKGADARIFHLNQLIPAIKKLENL